MQYKFKPTNKIKQKFYKKKKKIPKMPSNHKTFQNTNILNSSKTNQFISYSSISYTLQWKIRKIFATKTWHRLFRLYRGCDEFLFTAKISTNSIQFMKKISDNFEQSFRAHLQIDNEYVYWEKKTNFLIVHSQKHFKRKEGFGGKLTQKSPSPTLFALKRQSFRLKLH